MSGVRRTALAAALLAWLALPLVPVLLWAGAERWRFPAALPQEWGTAGWSEAAAAGLLPALGRSLALAVAVAALATPLGVAIGRVLGWRLARRPRLLVLVLLLPLLLPPLAVAMGLDVLLLRIGMPEVLGVMLVLVVLALPYVASTSAAGFARTPPALAEQARALGATPRQARWRVVLPAVRGSILVAALLAFLVGWSDYVVTVLVGGGQVITAPALLGSAAAGSGNEAAVAAIAASVVLPPVVLVLLAGRRREVGG
ncbi:hypothetical protein GCM10027425_10560 [Alteromonas gracilis]